MEIKEIPNDKNKIAILLEDLSSLENYAKDLLSFLPLPICMASLIGIVLEANPALEKISGYKIDELLGNPLENIFDKKDIKKLMKETLKNGSVSSQEIILITKDKKKISTSASALLRKNEQGETIGCFVGFFDLTAIKENEQELRQSQKALLNMLEDVEEEKNKTEEEKNKTLAIIKHLTDGLLVFDSQNYISLINPLGEKALKISGEEALGRSLTELAEKNTGFKLLLKLVGEEVKEVERQEFVSEKKTLEISSLSILKEGDRIGGLIILHDITHEKIVEKMKTEFVSIAAHQLRTPLSGVKWALSLLLEEDAGKLNEEQKSLIEKSYSSNERMINLVNDILNVARIEEGNYVFKLEPAHLEDLVKKTIDSCQELSEKKGILIDYKEPTDPFPLIMADSEKITLAVQNLIENAVKYTQPAGQVTISLKNDTNKIEFSIKDTGVGIAEEQKERIFTKFFRAPNVMRMETDGTGLGLFISKNIIESHGGKIWFESEENAGSTFYFWLPTINK